MAAKTGYQVIVNVTRPKLTPEEYKRRIEEIKRAAVAVLYDQEQARLRKEHENDEKKHMRQV